MGVILSIQMSDQFYEALSELFERQLEEYRNSVQGQNVNQESVMGILSQRYNDPSGITDELKQRAASKNEIGIEFGPNDHFCPMCNLPSKPCKVREAAFTDWKFCVRQALMTQMSLTKSPIAIVMEIHETYHKYIMKQLIDLPASAGSQYRGQCLSRPIWTPVSIAYHFIMDEKDPEFSRIVNEQIARGAAYGHASRIAKNASNSNSPLTTADLQLLRMLVNINKA